MTDSPPTASWYDEAEWYDIAFAWDTADEVDALRRIFSAIAARPVRRVYEPFCGSGRLTLPLADAGFGVVGADLSPAMIALAERKGAARASSASHFLADVRAWSPPGPIDAVVTLIDSFRHITDECDARSLLARWGRDVGPGGVIVIGLDLDTPDGAGCAPAEWTMERDGTTVHTRVESEASPDPGLSIMHAVMTVTRPGSPDLRVESRHPMRRYTMDSLARLGAEASLGVRRVTSWSRLGEDRPAAEGQAVVTLTPCPARGPKGNRAG